MTRTIGQQIKWNFETNGSLVILDKNGNQIYFEDSKKYWVKCEYDSKGCCIYYVDSDGYWTKREYDSKGNIIYHENSYDIIIDNRPKPCEGKIVEFEGEKFKLEKV